MITKCGGMESGRLRSLRPSLRGTDVCTHMHESPTAEHANGGEPVMVLGLVHFAKNVNPINSTNFVLFDKYCPIVDQLDSKDSSRDFQLNCVISYFFYLYLILHTSD